MSYRFPLKMKACLLFALYYFLLTPLFLHASSTEIQLIEHIGVSSPVVILNDIAHVQGADPILNQKVGGVVVDTISNVDSIRVISAFKIKQALEKEGYANCLVKGLQSKVYVETKSIGHHKIEKILTKWLQKELPKDTDVRLAFENIPREWRIPADQNIKFEISTSQKKLINNVSLNLKATKDGFVASTIHPRVHITLFKPMLVFSRDINKGEIIHKSDLRLESCDLNTIHGIAVDQEELIVGKAAKRNLKQASLVYANDLELPTLIERGSLNQIVIINGGIRMNLQGARALRDGKKGETIEFIHPLNEKTTLFAEVMQIGVAIVQIS